MDFDFYQTLKDLPTTELLKIVQRPAGYQPEAVVAANRLLSERGTTTDEEASVQAYFEERDNAARLKAEKIEHLKVQAADLLQPLAQPSAEINPEKWFRIFLVVMGLEYGWTLIQTLISIYKSIVRAVFGSGFGVHEWVGYKHSTFDLLDFGFFVNIATLFYIPYFFYLLYKKQRWGWILVFAGILVSVLEVPLQISAYISYLRATRMGWAFASFSWIIVQTLVNIAFGCFLWKPEICELFGVSKSVKSKTVIFTSVIVLLGFTATMFFSRSFFT